MSELPKGWTHTSINEVAEYNPKHSKELRDDLKVSFVPMPVLSETSPNVGKHSSRPLKEVKKGYTHFADGDVLLAKITPCFENGKAAIASNLVNGIGCGSTELHVLRPSQAVLPEYLYHFLHREDFRRAAKTQMTGTAGQLRVPSDLIKSLELPLPPLNEQKRIVAKLDELLPKVEACKQRLEKIPTILKRFRQSVLAAAVSGKLTEEWRKKSPTATSQSLYQEICSGLANEKQPSLDEETSEIIESLTEIVPHSWTVCQIGNLAKVMLGGTPSRKEPSYWNGDIPWISSGEVANCEIFGTAEKISSLGLDNSNAKLLQPGTILVAMIGEGKTRGQSAILRIEAASNQNSAALVFDKRLIVPEFVYLWMLYRYEATRSIGRGGNQPALNGEKVRNLPFVLPPLDEQREIVALTNKHLDGISVLEEKIRRALRYTLSVADSILSKAFAGSLVPQDPTDEPASALLERIKSSAPSQKQKRSPVRKSKAERESESLSA